MPAEDELLDKVDDYLSDRMEEPDRDAFECDLLDNPELQHEVVLQREMRDGLDQLRDALNPETEPGIFSRIHSLITSPPWAYTATILLPILFIFGGDQRGPAIQIIEGDTAPTVTIDASASTLNIDFDKGNLITLPIEGEVSINITRNAEVIFSASELTPDKNGQVRLFIPPITASIYKVQVLSPNSPAKTYTLQPL